MNAYTTIEESKQLIEAGLDVNTADGYLRYKWKEATQNHCFQAEYGEKIPCWSLTALLNIIDDNDIPYRLRNSPNSESGYFLSVKLINQEGMNKSVDIFDFDKVVGCITWLLERNYIKSNKNE